MIISKKRKSVPIIGILTSVAILVGFLSYIYQGTSDAANVSKFDPGNLISDSVMSNKSTMNVQQIQAFLDSKNNCNNTNTHMAAWYPHLQYTIRDGKFVCMAKDSFGGQSAAQIIWQVAQDYSINPQVLIVLLEKEQGLVSDTWPNNVQYRTATGYGCPDTAPCDSQYFGLNNQLRQAASLFRTVLNGGWSNYPVGHTYVQYNPNGACGGSVINIQNRATSALYRYTPYQPNQSALNAGYGIGDSCGAYGNRNFWMLFTDWFGNTQGQGFITLDDPRWMQVSKSAQKVHAYTGERFGPTIPIGAQAKFIDKVLINGQWIARTQWDHDNGNLDGFPANELSDIKFRDINSEYMVLNKDTKKINPVKGTSFAPSPKASLFKADSKVTVNNKTFYRTEWDDRNNNIAGFSEDDVNEFHMFDFIEPRYMITKKSVQKIDVLTGTTISTVPSNNIYFFNKLIKLSGDTYAQIKSDNSTNIAINADDLTEVNPNNPYRPFVEPRAMSILTPVKKINIFTGEKIEPELQSGDDAMFVEQINIDGTWYARSKWDYEHNNLYGIPVNKLTEINTIDITDEWMTIKKTTSKIDPVHDNRFEPIQKGEKALFVDKITVLGKNYYRTAWEAEKNRLRFIPAEDLSQ